MKLKYIGTNESMGLKHGEVYDVSIRSGVQYVWVWWGTNQGCPYDNLSRLLENWSEKI